MIELVDSFKKAPPDADVHDISPLLKEEVDDVYSFDCFTDQFISMFKEELDNFYQKAEQHNIPIRRPNSSKLSAFAIDTFVRDYRT